MENLFSWFDWAQRSTKKDVKVWAKHCTKKDLQVICDMDIPWTFSICFKDLLPAESGELATKSFLHELVDVLFAYICKSFRRSFKVLDFHHVHQLKDGVEGFTLELPDQPESLEQLLVDCRDTLRYGVKTGKRSVLYVVLLFSSCKLQNVKATLCNNLLLFEEYFYRQLVLVSSSNESWWYMVMWRTAEHTRRFH